MSDELKMAAERIERVDSGEEIESVYDTNIDRAERWYQEDERELARFAIKHLTTLAAREEEQEPVAEDEEILKRMKVDCESGNIILSKNYERSITLEGDTVWVEDNQNDAVPVPLIHNTTRGQVLSLLKALAIDAKGGA